MELCFFAQTVEVGPDAPRRTGLGEAGEDRGDRGLDGFVGMESDFAIGVAPDQSNRQAAPELPARRLVADPAVEASSKDIELRFTHRALQPNRRRSLNSAG